MLIEIIGALFNLKFKVLSCTSTRKTCDIKCNTAGGKLPYLHQVGSDSNGIRITLRLLLSHLNEVFFIWSRSPWAKVVSIFLFQIIWFIFVQIFSGKYLAQIQIRVWIQSGKNAFYFSEISSSSKIWIPKDSKKVHEIHKKLYQGDQLNSNIFPAFLTNKRPQGTMSHSLWQQTIWY